VKKHLTAAFILLLASNNFFLLLFGAWEYFKSGREADRAYASCVLDSVLVLARRSLDSGIAGPAGYSERVTYLGADCEYSINPISNNRIMVTVKALYKGRNYEKIYLSGL